MAGAGRRSGGDKKHGRSKRKPSHKRYLLFSRWISNKVKRLKRSAKREARLQRLRDKRGAVRLNNIEEI